VNRDVRTERTSENIRFGAAIFDQLLSRVDERRF